MLIHAVVTVLMAFSQDPRAATDLQTASEPTPAPMERIEFGPVWLGMSFSDARTALPDVAWREKPAPLNRSRISLDGPEAIDLFGRRYDVEIKPDVHGASRIDFHTAAPEMGIRQCRALVIETVAGLETRFGRFEALPNMPKGLSNELPNAIRMWTSRDMRMQLPGFLSVSAGLPVTEVFNAGGQSRVNFFASPGQRGRGAWQSIRQPANDDLTIGVGASYGPGLDSGRSTCDLYIVASHEPPRPEREVIVFEELVPLRTPTVADRHASLDFMMAEQLAALPEEGIDITVDCSVRRQYGTLLCLNPDVIQPEERHLITAAQLRGEGYVFETDNLQPESDIPLETRMTVRLKASDRIDISGPVEAPILAMPAVTWRRSPSRQWLTAQTDRLDRAGDYSVTARCQIQSDGSVICGELILERNEEPLTGHSATQLHLTGVRMIGAMLAAPELDDGTSSGGRWLDFRFVVRVVD